jgi:hypothetical protein
VCQGAERRAERFGGNQNDVGVIARGALECAKVKAHTGRRDAGQHHVSIAFRAARALKLNVDAFGQEIRFLHDAPLTEVQHFIAFAEAAMMERAWIVEFALAVPD